MTYKGHAVGGIIAAVAAWKLVPVHSPLVIGMLVLTLVGAQMPDIDHKGSWIGRRMFFLHVLLRISLYNPLTWLLFGRRRMKELVAHRGFTHTLLALFSTTLILFLIVLPIPPLLIDRGANSVFFIKADTLLNLWGLPLSFYPTSAYLATGWFLGYLSHIVLDMSTVSGVAILKPWSKEKFFLLPVMFRIRMKQWDKKW